MSILSCACIETLSVCVNTSYHWNWKSFCGHRLHTSVSQNCAQIRRLLKKSSPDCENFKNFKRVSISKVIEEVICFQLNCQLYWNYKSLHSTETALLRAHEDILGAIYNNRSVALLLLDLLAAFDRIDHGILLHRLEFCFGIKGSTPRHTREKTSDTQGTSNNALSLKSWIGNYIQGTEWTRIWLYYQPYWQMSLSDPYDPLISCSLKVPSTNTVSLGDHALSVAAPKLGNSLKNF